MTTATHHAPRIPPRWHATSIISYYFQCAVIACLERNGSVTLADCRIAWREAKLACIRHDRRFAGLVRL